MKTIIYSVIIVMTLSCGKESEDKKIQEVGVQDVGVQDTNASASKDQNASCEALSEKNCNTKACRPVFGSIYNIKKQCAISKRSFVICTSGDAQCNNAIQDVIVNKKGECWLQSSQCVPKGWKSLVDSDDSSHACSGAFQSKKCT